MNKKLVLIDGNSIAYRAFFALPLLSNSKGIHTNAVYGFAMMLNKIVKDEQPSHILVAFDAGKTTFRHETYKEYKGTRQKTPPELSEQFSYVRELLKAYGIPYYELENYEADDIIGTLSLEAENNGFQVKVYSGDKDLTQLATEKTTVCITRKGITDIEEYTPEHVREKYGLTPDQIIDMKGLMGDSSDNIPGVPGIGEKTAVKLLKQFHSVEALLESIDDVSGAKLKEKLHDNKDMALLSKELATIMRNVPLDVTTDRLIYSGSNEDQLYDLFRELEFKTLIEGLNRTEQVEETSDVLFNTITKPEPKHFECAESLYVEMIDVNYHKSPVAAIAVSGSGMTYFMTGETALASDAFKNWAEEKSIRKTVFDAKRTVIALRRHGIELAGIDFDVFLASYLINPSESPDDFAGVAKLHGETGIASDEAVYGKGAKRAIPVEEDFAKHVSAKAEALSRLDDTCRRELSENSQNELFDELELPLALILADMESEGVRVDMDRLEEMGAELKKRLEEMERTIHELAGTEFNINSPKQLGVILFEKLGLPPLKKTKTGYSTSAEVLEKLAPSHEIVRHILDYRQIGKLQSTYIEGLLKVADPETNKIHTRFNQALTQTGRLSSTEPNLQNIPIRLEEGRKIRQAFIPEKKDSVMFAADYSQIELRVLAHICGDEKLMEAFRQDMDIHTATAMEVFHVGQEDVTSNMRRQAKAVNFGIVYGISDYGLSQNLGITRKEAAEFIERYLNTYPGVKEYMDDIIREAKEKGYVTTLLNRRRYIPEITSRNFNLRSFGERTAMNTPIQGSAADIIKKAMIDVAERIEKESLTSKLLLQVHDELIFDVPKEEIAAMERIVPEVMEHAFELDVPLKVDYSFGPTWYDAK
ncbi:DNA polymerase I [Domibacillus epiphyticus]|uniref:DNA polymerase I n=1 Tax=Domibacillus epiphyticus TaxID=1714355 RepID=A0A1V2A910_9BACI|nr:DNA polymerase I [Domibacillus epiphyticus]OMP67473.1 DNA polymerase I [Domibacillus epiphyticus]